MSTRILLVGVVKSNHHRWQKIEALNELAALTKTSGGYVVERLIQVRPRFDPATLIGKGKAQELGEICRCYNIQLVIFDDELNPTQLRNLEEIIKVRVIDRTALILDIFALNARTAEAKVQVELAQLEYLKTRLTGLGIEMSRLGGGIGTRGPGETKLEVDRRRIEQRIDTLRKRLRKIERERMVQRKRRKNIFQLTLAGYTNSGKSTLFNRLTNSDVKVSEQMFATLDASTRLLEWGQGVPIVITDTVGFIRNLPPQLVASFRSTLAEIKDADIVVHVADASDDLVTQKIDVVNETLREIGAGDKPTILTFNKIDRVFDNIKIIRLEENNPGAVFLSAITGDGLDILATEIEKILEKQLMVGTFTVPSVRRDLIARIINSGKVVSKIDSNGQCQLTIKGMTSQIARLRKLLRSI
ncbi:MAG: GTPase HflX [bacterium]